MDPSQETQFKVSCPHCGQHLVSDRTWAGQVIACPGCQEKLVVPAARQFRCPCCSTPLGLFPEGEHPTECPRCGWQRPGASEAEGSDEPMTPRQRGVSVTTSLIIGALSPWLVMVAMMVTLVTGPLALVLAPLAGFWLGKLLGAVVVQRVGPKWFWWYVAAGVVSQVLVLLWPTQWHGGSGGNEAAAFAAPALAVVFLLQIGAAVFWLLGAFQAWVRARSES